MKKRWRPEPSLGGWIALTVTRVPDGFEALSVGDRVAIRLSVKKYLESKGFLYSTELPKKHRALSSGALMPGGR